MGSNPIPSASESVVESSGPSPNCVKTVPQAAPPEKEAAMPRRTNHEGTFRRRGNSGQVGVQIAGHRHWASAPTRAEAPRKLQELLERHYRGQLSPPSRMTLSDRSVEPATLGLAGLPMLWAALAGGTATGTGARRSGGRRGPNYRFWAGSAGLDAPTLRPKHVGSRVTAPPTSDDSFRQCAACVKTIDQAIRPK